MVTAQGHVYMRTLLIMLLSPWWLFSLCTDVEDGLFEKGLAKESCSVRQNAHVRVAVQYMLEAGRRQSMEGVVRFCVGIWIWLWVCFQPLTTFLCYCCEESDPAVLIKTNGTHHSPLIVFHWQMAPLTPEDCCREPARLEHTQTTNENCPCMCECMCVCVCVREQWLECMSIHTQKRVCLFILYSSCQAGLLCTSMCKVRNTAALDSE